ncbi:sulfatase [Rubellicoccus peritrichatus]|uniref:Sulfatase n=1 Tax=Rubellicoccus peritrichatus TaxID=3080537 RepID=A0AAQ3LBZ7_9BACT|nr:sulfatase [Puniceicoccus sp. CR14]WOO43304.1 sulfatase [Puniceicoccus sp. CR14]
MRLNLLSLIFILVICSLQALKAKPNVVLILADDMSPTLSLLGTPGIETPNIDALATQGVYFENAFAASASCSPSRTAILTGMWPHSNGNWRNVHTPRLDLPDKAFSKQTDIRDKVGIGNNVPTLPELMQANGYFTAITQKLHLSPAWRYPFDARNPVQSNPVQFHSAISSFIQKSGEKPFFIMANVAAPHRPYRTHLKQNPGQELPAADTIEVPPFLPDLPGVRRDMQEYYACVEIADACAGAILEALEDSGELDNTLVIFTSDQGMPIHHAKASAYPAGIQIPLVIAGPGVKGGREVGLPVSQVDYAPTILNYCKISVPANMQGQSLMPVLDGGDSLPGREYVFAEHNSHGPDPREFFPQRVVTDGTWYYILNLDPRKPQRLPDDLRGVEVWGNYAYADILAAQDTHAEQALFLTQFDSPRAREHLYRLDQDPWGVDDLVGDSMVSSQLRKLREVMENWRRETNDIKRSPLEIPEHAVTATN